MSLVTSKELFQKSYKKYAIGAFNISNMELIQGIMKALNELRSPAILQVTKGARNYAGSLYIKNLIKAASEQYPDIPLVLHLDHGENFEICKAAIDDGFTSVMIDASHHSFEKNVNITKEVVEYAHDKGVVVEAELGRLSGVEDHVNVSEKDAVFTDPSQAQEFIEKTGCDSLAIAIGTSHGAYKFKGIPYLDLARLDQIVKSIPSSYPLVLHGASSILKNYVETINLYGGHLNPDSNGVPEELLKQATQKGICKINIDTDLRLAFTASIRETFSKSPEEFDPRFYLKQAREAIYQVVKHKIENILGSANTI